uniref:Uncharacterized protein n=1 Tax=Aegilops tauschii subsp. strangulata TaxID=200361 RepID=A0A453HEQ5_AEGTS
VCFQHFKMYKCRRKQGTRPKNTYDCHILLQRILPSGMRGFLDSDIYEAIAELGKFF